MSYAIGVAQPLSVHVDTYETGKIPDKEILKKVLDKFDFRPGAPCTPHPQSTAPEMQLSASQLWTGTGTAGAATPCHVSDWRRAAGAGMMARNLDLQRGGNRFIKTAAYGHFGRDDLDVFTWEKVCCFEVPHGPQGAHICLDMPRDAVLRIL